MNEKKLQKTTTATLIATKKTDWFVKSVRIFSSPVLNETMTNDKLQKSKFAESVQYMGCYVN